MATDVTPDTKHRPNKTASPKPTWMQLLEPLASLKLTVFLFALSIVLIMIGTLAQEDESMWDVLQNYFRTWIAWVPVSVFFPESFFPKAAFLNRKLSELSGVFPFVGGWTLGLALAVNLLAAHLVRFKFQAKGQRLGWGLVLMGMAAAVITAIIYAGQTVDGTTIKPERWDAVWSLIRWGTAAVWLASAAWVITTPSESRLVFWSKTILSVALGATAFWLVVFGEQNQLDDASIRILWQLIQGTLAGVLLLWGSWIAFKRRAGIVVIHLGVGLLMFGELLVSLKAVEERMFIREGETVSRASESRVLELAVIDRSPEDHDQVISIPVSELLRGERFEHPDLPFAIEPIEFMKNTKLYPTERLKQLAGAKSTDNPNDFLSLRLLAREEFERPTAPVENRATSGTGRNIVAVPARTLGASVDRENEAALYAKIIDPDDEDTEAPTLLLAQRYGDASMLLGSVADVTETVLADGKTYELALRSRRNYKPFSITLEDIRKEDYIGTATPRDYSSYVVLNDPSQDVSDQRVRIWMNNPLRYGGLTFYQSGYHPMESGEATTLQLVTNTGWMIPYVACMLVVVGLVAHFLLALTRFVGRQTRQRERKVVRGDRRTNLLALVAIPAIAATICLMFVGKALRPKPTLVDGMNLTEFGKLPVVFEGRIKPLDTLARNSLQVVSNKQTYKDTTLTETSRQPAIKWFLDVITSSNDADKHQTVSISNLDVLNTLGLEPRQRFLYAVEEFVDQLPVFDIEVRKAYDISRQNPEQLTKFHRALLNLRQRLLIITKLRDAFTPLPFPEMPSAEMRAQDPEAAQEKLKEIANMAMAVPRENKRLIGSQPPLVVPVESQKTEWLPFAAAVNQAYVQQLLQRGEVNNPTLLWNDMLHAYAKGDGETFNRKVNDFELLLTADGPKELEMPKVGFESYFNRLAPFYWCMVLYVVGFTVNAGGWLGWYDTLRRLATWIILFTLALHTFALVGRIYISGRPPVTNLYSSAVFIGWGAVILAIALEYIYKISIGNVIAAASGFSTLFIAHNLAAESGDTFTVLQAVLDTQFWLATHVVCITLGYTTTFVAGGLATIYILGSVLTRAVTPDIAKSLARMTYGVICFSIFFSFFGTVLGGLWADDSWGRFWGWDPKENGALIIVLWNALILHARWGGMIRDRGLCVLAVIGNVATAWSWFGVNELGIGLHAYADSEKSVKMELGLYALSQLALVVIGLLPLRWWRGGPKLSA